MRRFVSCALMMIAVGSAGACIRPAAFPCERDEQCDAGSGDGVCQLPEGYCAYEDAACEGGFRFESRAPNGLGGECSAPSSADTSSGTSNDSDGESTGEASCGGPFESCCDESCSGSLVCLGVNCGCGFIATAGEQHTCFVHTDGTTECWGNNERGQLGRTTTGLRDAQPAFVEGLPAPLALSDADGSDHTCVATLSGRVYCWGSNGEGQANADSLDESVPRAHLVADETTFVGWAPRWVATGSRHTCVAGFDDDAEESHVFCWGDNTGDQLGWSGGQPEEVDTAGWRGEVEQLEAGDSHSCVLSVETTGAHHVYCWGLDEFGQLGGGEGDQSGPTPVEVELPADTRILELSASGAHTCAIADQDGVRSIVCWGSNLLGQAVADGSTMAAVPTPVAGLPKSGWLSVAAGADATCATSEDDGMWCWGSNLLDKLLPGDNPETLPPTRIPLLDIGTEAVIPAVGEFHTCAITIMGDMRCWGDGSSGQLGPDAPFIPPPDASPYWTITPTCG